MTENQDTLKQRLLSDPSKRGPILTDCERLIQDEVDRKSGLSGMAIKGAYKIVCAIKPGIIREAMDHLLDAFVDALEPLFAEHLAGGGAPEGFADYLRGHTGVGADALLGITDARAARAQQKTMKKAYEKLRPQAKKHVEEALPRAGDVLVRHL